MKRPPPIASYLIVWALLLALLAMSAGSAYLRLGALNNIVNLSIAGLKAILIAIFFMHLRHCSNLVRVFALVAPFMLAMLIGLASGDYATRAIDPAPFQATGTNGR